MKANPSTTIIPDAIRAPLSDVLFASPSTKGNKERSKTPKRAKPTPRSLITTRMHSKDVSLSYHVNPPSEHAHAPLRKMNTPGPIALSRPASFGDRLASNSSFTRSGARAHSARHRHRQPGSRPSRDKGNLPESQPLSSRRPACPARP